MATATETRMVEALPLYYGGTEDTDPVVSRWTRAQAAEIDRLRAMLAAIRDETIPISATDTMKALSRWEATLGLPVAPVGATMSERVAALLARILGRRVAYGVDYRAALDAALQGNPYTFEANTPGPNEITVTIPYAPGSFTAGLVEELLVNITPANQLIHVQYTGFIVGESNVGDII